MITKIGENLSGIQLETPESCLPLINEEINQSFISTANELKRVAPQADDFLFFSAVMMHAAEASAINDDGSVKMTKEGKPVEVGWRVDANGSWKWHTNDPSIKPYKNCFVPGTKVVMSDGSVKNIEDIKAGDYVITSLGNSKKVLRTFETPHNGKLIKLNFSNGLSVVTTNNHEFYSGKIKPRQIKNKNIDLSFIPAENLNVGDYSTSSLPSYKIDKYINYSFAKLIGLFAAEGSYIKSRSKIYGICFSVNKTEQHLIDFISSELFKAYGKNPVQKIQNNKCDIKLYLKKAGEEFFNYCGEYSYGKTISSDIVFNSDNNVKSNFISGWLEGDGCVDKYSGKIVGTTISDNMSSQIKLMLDSMKIQNGIFKDKDSYRIKIPFNVGKVAFSNLSKFDKLKDKKTRSVNKSDFSNNYRFHKIIKKEDINYSGNVHNIEVEDDNSYCVTHARINVHNCNADIFPENELVLAHKKWIGKPLCIDHKSSSVDHVRGFIVDTYYDRKLKRVVALCALDKKNYPDLAHKVAVGITPSVSMGTGVSTAICTDCGRVARAENDFCDHMKTKSCYGEINIGLNPIELSIVVNPADTKAQIKHIIAAAESLDSYIKSKESQINKIAKPIFHANLGFSDQKEDNGGFGNSANFSINGDDLPSFLKDLNSIIKKLKKMLAKSEDKKSDENEAEDSEAGSSTVIAPPAEKQASLNIDLESLATRIDSIKQGLDRILQEETDMSDRNKKAYFQGTEEPTPGEVKYDKDPKNENLREKGDKQMDVDDMGPVDGMHPGPKSVGMGELERKKMLARAEAEERALKRAAIVDLAKSAIKNAQDSSEEPRSEKFLRLKSDAVFALNARAPRLAELIHKQESEARMKEELEVPTVKSVVTLLAAKFPALKALCDHVGCSIQKAAYFQGGGGVNEPTPGKPKYPVDKTNVDLRDEDKQMVGAKPFPEVGDTSKLYSDDQKVKEKILRASLDAKFIKASTEDGAINLDRSCWEVYNDGALVLKASVNELTGGNGELFYDTVATKEFGKKLVTQIKTSGAAKVAKMYKLGQAAPAPAPAPMPDLGGDLPPAPEAAPQAPAANDQPADMSDPKQQALSLVDQVKNTVSDLGEVVNSLADEESQMGEPAAQGGNEPAKTASFTTRALHGMRKELNSELGDAIKSCLAELNDHKEELDQIVDMCNRKVIANSNANLARSIFESTFDDVKSTLASAKPLLEGFVSYAKAVDSLVKRAQMESSLEGLDSLNQDDSELGSDLGGDSESDLDFKLEDLVSKDFEDEDVDAGGDVSNDFESDVSDELGLDSESSDLESDSDEDLGLSDENEADLAVNHNALPMLDKNKVKPGDKVTVTASLDTKEGRMALRAKLAKDSMKMKVSPLLHEAHPKGGTTPKFETQVSDDLDHVEDLEEVQKEMMDAVNAPTPKVKKEAEMIHKLISEGSLSVDDLDDLVAEGADKDAVAYYKKYYGQVDGGSEFASELVKEHAAKKAKADLEVQKLKLARAYEMAYEMAEKGLCEKKAIASKVDEIMKYNDESFESLKAIVSSTSKIAKKANKMPAVGYGDDSYPSKEEDLVSQLSAVLSSSKRRMF